MDGDRAMYRWRRMTAEERTAALEFRKRHSLPWHGPPHYESEAGIYLVTAACYEHRPIIGISPVRMAGFEAALLEAARSAAQRIFSWVVLPNHYHILVHAPELRELIRALGQLHGRTSHRWNGEENKRGRQIWHRAVETAMKSERHFWATVNYVLNNPVRHRHAERWQDWPYSSAVQYLAEVGHEEAVRRWREYPVLDYGDDWDDPEM